MKSALTQNSCLQNLVIICNLNDTLVEKKTATVCNSGLLLGDNKNFEVIVLK